METTFLEKSVRKSIFESCVQVIRNSISEISYKLGESEKNLVPFWNFSGSNTYGEKRVNIHCLYLIFLNVICERINPASIERMLSVLEKVLSRTSFEFRDEIIMVAGESARNNLHLELCDILFNEYCNRFMTHSNSEPLDCFMFVYLGLSLKKFSQLLEGIMAFASFVFTASSPSLDYSVKGEDGAHLMMHSTTELSLILSIFHYSLYSSILKNTEDSVKSFDICENALKFLSQHKAIMVFCVFVLRCSHISLAFSLERYDIVDLMLEDFESVDEQHHPIDFHLYFMMLFKLQNSIDMDDIFERNNRHRAYSIHSQGLWNKIDPVINEALQNQLGVPSSIDEGYRYITFLSREECSEILKDKAIGCFLVRPQSNTDSTDISASEDFYTQFLLSFRSAPTNNGSTSPTGDLVKHAVIRREKSADGTFKYRCGKLGPTSELIQILNDISGILSSGLKFEQIVPSAIPLFDSGFASADKSKCSKQDILSVVDINHRFFTSLYKYLPILLNNVMVDPRFSRKFSMDNLEDLSQDDDSDSTGDTANTEEERFQGIIAEESLEEYELEKSEIGYHDISVTLLRFLCWKKFVLQSVPLLFIFEVFAVGDSELMGCFNRLQSSSSFESSTRSMFQVLIMAELYVSPVFYSSQTLVTLEDIFEGDVKEYNFGLMQQLLSSCLRFLIVVEERLTKMMLIPPYSAVMTRQNRSNCGLMWYYANTYRDREALVVEAMLQRFLRNMSPIAVKLNANTNGIASGNADSVLAMDCVETNVLIPTMGQFLAHLDEFLNQPASEISNNQDPDYYDESKADPFYEVEGGDEAETLPPGETLSDKIRHNLEHRKNQQLFYRDSVVGETLKKLTSPLDTLFAFQPTNTANRPVPSNNSAFTNYEAQTGHAPLDKKMLQLLSIVKDILCNSNFPYYPYSTSKSLTEETASSNNISVDMAQRVITLLYRHKSLRQFVKPADLAFLPSISYYKYVDLWEVKAISEDSNGRELIALGRHVYRTVPFEIGGSIKAKTPYLPIACTLFFKGKQLSKDDDPTEQVNVELKPFAKLWSKVRAEEYILNAITKVPSYCYDDSNKPMARPFIQALDVHLYKNVMLKRMHMPYRFCGFVQVDLYGLKQVIATKSIGKRPDDALVTPSQTAHQSSIELFAVIKLIKNYKVDDSGGVLYADSIFHSGNPDQLIQSGNNPRSIQEGSYLTPAKRVEPHMSGMHGKKSNVESSGGSCSKITLAQITQSFDYDFRCKGSFRFALPECWLGTFLNQNPDNIPTHGQEELYGHIRSSPPLKIAVTIYEKMFFGDIKVGQAEIDMSNLTDNVVIRDWFPLRGETQTFSWLVYSQAKLQFQLMQMDDLPDEFPYNSQIDVDKMLSSSMAPIKETPALRTAKETPSSRMELESSHHHSVPSTPSVRLPTSNETASSTNTGSTNKSTAVPNVNQKAANLMSNMKSVFSPSAASNVASSFINAVGKPISSTSFASLHGKTEKPAPPKSQKKFLSHLDDLF